MLVVADGREVTATSKLKCGLATACTLLTSLHKMQATLPCDLHVHVLVVFDTEGGEPEISHP